MNRHVVYMLNVMVVMLPAAVGNAQITIPGADGSDGAFSPTTDTQVDLSQAPTVSWDTPSSQLGTGVYDAAKWAVVFKYTEVNVPAGVTVTFKNHPSRAPVVWLVQGNVTIEGVVSLNGQDQTGDAALLSVPGSGGFRGGRARFSASVAGSAGLGPGGGDYFATIYGDGRAGAYASGQMGIPTYGNAGVVPLIGGSGGSGASNYGINGGGAGGGAILIGAGSTINISASGVLEANGGDGGAMGNPGQNGGAGSGGGIRLAGNTVTGAGQLNALGGYRYGGDGRIRVEANNITLTNPGNPAFTKGVPADPAVIWPSAGAPTVRAVSLGGVLVPEDPRAELERCLADVLLGGFASLGPQTIMIEARNVPVAAPAGPWIVAVRVVNKYSAGYYGSGPTVNATFVSGDNSQSLWQASLTLPTNYSAIQVRVSKP